MGRLRLDSAQGVEKGGRWAEDGAEPMQRCSEQFDEVLRP